jgi:putative endonuclease
MSDRQHGYWTYIMASVSRVIYVGVTNDLERRVWEHKQKAVEGFTRRYNCMKLVWFEEFREIRDAIACEKRIKGLLRARKIALVEEKNPYWRDLSEGWYRDAMTENDRDSSPAKTGSE